MSHSAQNKTPNGLINESSPYLLQHAYNPVNWVPFTENVFEQAKQQNKIVIISIGYSACHWCHVMERECFEDKEAAGVMNAYFINVKVDREERPDVDMLYMQAVQLMTGRGGWPLNVMVLPDGRPFYGGTYFPKHNWINALVEINKIFEQDPEKVEVYATRMMEAINQAETLTTTIKEMLRPDRSLLRHTVEKWKERLDYELGGPGHVPKFPLPCNYAFLLRYAILENDDKLLNQVNLTLQKMAFGGIYDQLHGGFARYSTDREWKVPHFEKMLYDNAQLISLYIEAYLLTGNKLYGEIAQHCLAFVNKEWRTKEGLYYSAFDADSEGEEGKYYVWQKEELEELLGEDFEVFAQYYQVNETGYWEHGNYILMRTENEASILADKNIDRKTLIELLERCRKKLREQAAKRVKPGLDNKRLTAWNAMMCSALAQAYLAFGDIVYKSMALETMQELIDKLRNPDGLFLRLLNEKKQSIDGFLDDQAFAIAALIDCYLLKQDETYLNLAREISEIVDEKFKNDKSHLLFYTSGKSYKLAARTSETGDNVVPSSNSQMALNFYRLSLYFDRPTWAEKALAMLQTVLPEMRNYGAGYGHWASLALGFAFPGREIAIVGNNVDEKLLPLWQQGHINTIFAVGKEASALPLLKDRYREGQTLIYVCENKTCSSPVATVEEALKQLG